MNDGILARLRGLFSRTDPEQKRRQRLKAQGRIVEGLVIDIIQQGESSIEREIDPNLPCIIVYRYTTSSVTYESAEELSPAQIERLRDYRIGKYVSVRYDPRRPADSLLE